MIDYSRCPEVGDEQDYARRKKKEEKQEERKPQDPYTLHTTRDWMSFEGRIDILDENDNIRYYTVTQPISFVGETDIFNHVSNRVATIKRAIISMNRKRTVTMSKGESFDVERDLLNLGSALDVLELGWTAKRTSIRDVNFTLIDEDNYLLARISRKPFTYNSFYEFEIYRKELEAKIVAVIVVLMQIAREEYLS